VNGVNIGRYWSVGPQQTLYIPGVWLNKGENKIVVFEQQNHTPQTSLKCVKTPVLQELRLPAQAK
jgi:beta-galactosidase